MAMTTSNERPRGCTQPLPPSATEAPAQAADRVGASVRTREEEWARAALRRVVGDAMARAAHVLGWLDEWVEDWPDMGCDPECM